MKERLKNKRGITLVALVVTIIVLLILAAVSINLVLGENGIITRSKEASEVSFKKNVQEALELVIADLNIVKQQNGKKVGAKDLLNQGYINNDYVIDIDKLLGEPGPYGNGENKKDVFVIEKDELWYYDQEGQGEKISDLENLGYIPTSDEYFESYEEYSSFDPILNDPGAKYIGLKDYAQYYDWPYVLENAPLTEYIIPNELNGETMDIVGHYNAKNIKKIIIQDGIKKIGTSAFEYCDALEEVEMPNSITVIASGVFTDCLNLEKVTMSDNITYIGRDAFMGCEKLKNIELKEGLTEIDTAAFSGCRALESINLPDSLEKIRMDAFKGCRSIKNIRIPPKVTAIYTETFRNCTSLETIIIPKSVTFIIDDAFSGCTNLQRIYYTGTEEEWNQINIEGYSNKIASTPKTFEYQE